GFEAPLAGGAGRAAGRDTVAEARIGPHEAASGALRVVPLVVPHAVDEQAHDRGSLVSDPEGLTPPQLRLAGGPGLVEAAARGEARGLLEAGGVAGPGGGGEATQGGDEPVEALLGFRFGRLDQ